MAEGKTSKHWQVNDQGRKRTVLNSLYLVSFNVRNFDTELLKKEVLSNQEPYWWKHANLLYGHDDFDRVQAV